MVIGSLEARERLALIAEAKTTPSHTDEVALLLEELEQLGDECRRLAAANENLKWHAIHMENSRRRLMEAHESGKRAISEELHGRVQTLLYANWFKLSNLLAQLEERDAPEAAELSTLIDDLNDIREDEVRKLSHRLHPSVIRMGVAPAIRSLISSLGDLVDVEFTVSDRVADFESGDKSEIPEEARLAVYRVAELALGNVLKHSEAEHCTVEFDITEEEVLLLSITDDGVGFPPAAKASTGMGVATMDDYADSIGGKLTITSLPGEGTRVEMQVPLLSLTSNQSEQQAPVGTLVDMHWAAPRKPTAG